MYYMYSLEPPIYYYLNQACRDMDQTQLDTLGPYACVMFNMLSGGSWCDKKRKDKMRRGYDYGSNGPLGYFSQSFLTFRGVKMGEPKWLDAYLKKVGQKINMPGTTSTSSNLGVALDFSKCSILDIAMTGKSVLFVFFFKNYARFAGFRLNQPEYSA